MCIKDGQKYPLLDACPPELSTRIAQPQLNSAAGGCGGHARPPPATAPLHARRSPPVYRRSTPASAPQRSRKRVSRPSPSKHRLAPPTRAPCSPASQEPLHFARPPDRAAWGSALAGGACCGARVCAFASCPLTPRLQLPASTNAAGAPPPPPPRGAHA